MSAVAAASLSARACVAGPKLQGKQSKKVHAAKRSHVVVVRAAKGTPHTPSPIALICFSKLFGDAAAAI